MYSNAYIWSKVLSYLETHSPSMAVNSFFDDAEIVELKEDNLVLYSPSPFRKDVIMNRYTLLIQDAMRELYSPEFTLGITTLAPACKAIILPCGCKASIAVVAGIFISGNNNLITAIVLNAKLSDPPCSLLSGV